MASSKIRVMVWNENRHEKSSDEVARVYPQGIHGAIAEGLGATGEFEITTATLDEPEHGLTEKVLERTDVLTWWGHIAHGEVDDTIVSRVQQRVLSGMGLIALHSGHHSKILRRVLGTNCSLRWREMGEKERLWNLAPAHPITRGIGEYIELPHTEMYGEPFGIPEPDKLIFVSWFEGGEVFRSGCVWERENGRIFYFKPGHETYPIFYNQEILKVIANAIRWAAPRHIASTKPCPRIKEPLEQIGGE